MSSSIETPRLPIPALADTARRYLHQLRPLLDDDAFAHTQAEVAQFIGQPGPALQQALQDFDQQAAAAGKSWLSDTWLDSYLQIRTPLPLASSIGITVPMRGHDLADWVAAIARVCADYRHQRIKPPLSPSGAPHCMVQWQILRGGARVPQPGLDRYHLAPAGARHAGVLHNGFYYRLAVLDDNGEALPAATLRSTLAQIAADTTPNPQPLAVPCYLGSEQAASVLGTLAAQHPGNAALLGDIQDDLFHICLRSTAVDEDSGLAQASFVPQQDVWCYKPFSLIHHQASEHLWLHCEHSWEDGGTLLGILSQAVRQLADPALAAAAIGAPAPGGTSATPGQRPPASRQASPPAGGEPPARHGWQMESTLRQQWAGWQADYAARAGKLQIRSLLVPYGPHAVPASISQDALMQFLLQYAQLATWGTIRNTYEAVDVSHFQRGRTECVRPVSMASSAFVARLLAGEPDADSFAAALAEHKARIRACKQGQGPNRHLLGLQEMARRQGLPMPALFQDAGYQTFTTDFLSTSTLGNDDIMRAIGFSPTSRGGLGIYYTRTRQGWLYVISHAEDAPAEVAAFMQALSTGGQRLLAFVSSSQR